MLIATLQLIWSIAVPFANTNYSVCIYSSTDLRRPLREWALFASIPATQTNLFLHGISQQRWFVATLKDNRAPVESDPSPIKP